MSNTWTHKGVTITFDADRAVFRATAKKKPITAPSLDAIKKKIDAENKFEPFDCYVEMQGWGWKAGLAGVAVFLKGQHRGERALVEGKVIGIEKPSRMAGKPEFRVEFLDSRGKRAEQTHRAVLPRTPEAKEAWRVHWEASEQFAQAENELEEANKAKLSPLHAAMPYRRAGEE